MTVLKIFSSKSKTRCKDAWMHRCIVGWSGKPNNKNVKVGWDYYPTNIKVKNEFI